MASKHFCQPCKRGDTCIPADKWCTECEEKLCKDCFQFHGKCKVTKSHNVLDISYADILPMLGKQHCSKHSEKLLNLFCVEHDVLSCTQCMTEKHRACSTLLPLDCAAKGVRSSALVSDLSKDLDHSVKAFGSFRTTIGQELKGLEDKRIATNQSIITLKTRFQNDIEKSATVLSEQIDKVCEDHRLRFQEQEHRFTDSMILYTERQEELEKGLKHGSESQVFILAHQMKLQLTKDEEKASSIDQRQKLDRIEIRVPEKHALRSFPLLEDIVIEKTLLKVYDQFRKVHVAEPICHIDSDRKLYWKSTNNFKSIIKGIAVTKHNNVLICLENDCTVTRCLPDGKVDKSCQVGGKVYNICVIDETDEAVVTLPYTGKIQFIKFISMEVGKTVETLQNPWGITLHQDKLVVGSSNKIQFLTKDGIPLHIVDVTLEKNEPILYMHPGYKNQIYVSCHSFHCITEEGKLLLKYNAPAKNRTNGICIDRDGNIYVASKNSFVRLSKEGTVLDQNIVDKEQQYGDIWGIAFNRTYTQMYAATNDGFQLTVFDFK